MRKRKIWNGRKDISLPFLFAFLFFDLWVDLALEEEV